MERPAVEIRFESGDAAIRCVIDVGDPSLHGRSAELRVARVVKVKDKRPVNASDVVYRSTISSLQAQNTVDIPRKELRAFSYDGAQISIEVSAELEIAGMPFDAAIRRDEELPLGPKPAISGNAKEIVDPADAIDFVANLKAIAPAERVITVGLVIVGAVVIAVNTWLGWHDQSAPADMTYFYDQRGSDGGSASPLQKALAMNGVLGIAIWGAIKAQLRKYMTLHVVGVPARLGIDFVIEAGRLLRGFSRIDLRGAIVRVVAFNMESGRYKRGWGTQERTVSFAHPARAVILYDRRLELLPARTPLEDQLDGVIRFELMFRALYPPQPVGKDHGLTVHWEVQLIHDKLADQEIVCASDCLVWEDFLRG